MLRKIGKSGRDQLIEHRHSDLERMVKGSMRSHGKLWGMDTFSWFHPDQGALNATVKSLPFSVIWIPNYEHVEQTIAHDPTMAHNVDALVAYNGKIFHMATNLLNSTATFIGTQSIADALRLTKEFQDKPRVILFSSSRTEWHDDQLEFEHFLAAVKAL
jgi:hypothetical protein